MKNVLPLLLLLISICACAQQEEEEQGHWDPTHNFTVIRLIIINENNEMLLGREDHVWAPPSMLFDQRYYSNEGLDSLTASIGIKVEDVQFRGYFGFKYEYHPYATRRAYYVARYQSGTAKLNQNSHEVGWFPMEEALEMINVTAIQQITKQLVKNPNSVWGGSFMVYRDGVNHPTEMVEPFYKMFGE